MKFKVGEYYRYTIENPYTSDTRVLKITSEPDEYNCYHFEYAEGSPEYKYEVYTFHRNSVIAGLLVKCSGYGTPLWEALNSSEWNEDEVG